MKTSEDFKEFIINPFLKVKLEDGSSNIYVGNRRFIQCKYLLLNIIEGSEEKLDEIDSIDEAAEILDHSLEGSSNNIDHDIDAETEFWAHCSNLQAWYEHDYDTRLIHKNLSFYLLQELARVGDKQASKVYIEEVAKRFSSRFPPVQIYLINQGHLYNLSREQLELVIDQETIDNLIKKYPHGIVLKSQIGLIYGKLKFYDKALTLIKEVEDSNPEDYSIWERIGFFYYIIMHDYKRALKAFKRSLRICPDNSKYIIYSLMGWMYITFKNFDKAKECLEKSLELNPQSFWSLTRLGFLNFEQGNLKKAKRFFKKALDADPFQENAYSHLGEMYYFEKNYKEAEIFFRKELDRTLDHYESLYYMGCIYNLKKEYHRAIIFLEQALRYDEFSKRYYTVDDFSIWKQLCLSYYKIREYDKSYEITQKVLRLKPEDIYILDLVKKIKMKR